MDDNGLGSECLAESRVGESTRKDRRSNELKEREGGFGWFVFVWFQTNFCI